jgi:hypothetical protein
VSEPRKHRTGQLPDRLLGMPDAAVMLGLKPWRARHPVPVLRGGRSSGRQRTARGGSGSSHGLLMSAPNVGRTNSGWAGGEIRFRLPAPPVRLGVHAGPAEFESAVATHGERLVTVVALARAVGREVVPSDDRQLVRVNAALDAPWVARDMNGGEPGEAGGE